MTLVSIVIPTYNKARDLGRALRSVLAQTHEEWEALVVDNHSTDGTDEVIATFHDPRIRFAKIHNEGVIAASRNAGLGQARGIYVAFLDSDDWWLPTKLEESIRALERGADVVYHDLFIVTREGQRGRLRKAHSRQLVAPVFDDLLTNGNTLSTSSVVARTSVLRDVGGFREARDIVGWEDYDLWLRLAKATPRFHRIASCLGYYWRGGGNYDTAAQSIKNTDAIGKRYLEEYVLPPTARRSVWWPAYAKGRAFYHLHDLRAASASFASVLSGHIPAAVRLKTFVYLILIAGKGVRPFVRGAAS